MVACLVSLAMGLAVGAVYGLVQVRSPAPPLIALVGLLGMVLGEQAVSVARHRAAPVKSEPPGAAAEPVRPSPTPRPPS